MNAAERYDWECAHVLGRTDQDLDWYVSIASRCGGPILELACGTGRIARPLEASTGLPVVGLDIDVDMLLASGLPRRVAADMRTFAFRPVFALVVIAYNSLQLLDEAGRRACLVAAAGAGHHLAVECTDFQHDVAAAEVGPELLAEDGGIAMYGSVEHDLAARTSRYRRRFVGAGFDATDTFTIASLSADDTRCELAAAGWRVTDQVEVGASVRMAARVS